MRAPENESRDGFYVCRIRQELGTLLQTNVLMHRQTLHWLACRNVLGIGQCILCLPCDKKHVQNYAAEQLRLKKKMVNHMFNAGNEAVHASCIAFYKRLLAAGLIDAETYQKACVAVAEKLQIVR